MGAVFLPRIACNKGVSLAQGVGARLRNAQRLLRSARKLDPGGKLFDARALKILDVG